MKKLLAVIVLVFAVFVVSIPHSSAQTIYACVNTKSGVMRYVGPSPTSCRGGESLISWNQEGPQGQQGDKGEKGDTGDPGTPGIGAIQVIAANEVVLGTLLEISEYIGILIPSLSKAIHISAVTGDIVEKAFDPPFTPVMYFVSSNCTGQMYLNASWSNRIFKSGGIYYTGAHITPVSLEINSYSYGTCTQATYPGSGLVPAEITELPFTLPVALPLAFAQ